MNYLNIAHCNMVNGDGLRTVIWVSGCDRHCPGCFSPHTWPVDAGQLFDKDAEDELFRDSNEDWCSGITFCGGDPLHQCNRHAVIALAKKHKEKFPQKTIWLYTGWTFDEVKANKTMREVLDYVDVLCDGPFIEKLKDPLVKWVGSSNQNVIDVKKRLQDEEESKVISQQA